MVLYVICILLGLILLGSVVGVVVHFCYSWFSGITIESFVDDAKCPACYGVDLCPAFYAGDVKFHQDFQNAVLTYVNAKNVFEVLYKAGTTQEKAIVKKLAHNWELKSLDTKVCQLFGSQSECNMNDLVNIELWDDIIRMVEFHGHKSVDKTGLTLCPSTDGIYELLKPFESNDTQSEKILAANLWTILTVNPEPIILKFLNADSSPWPVPKYYGACGRATLQQYGGKMLSTYLSESWPFRADLAIKLLAMADTFTFRHSRFRFYLTDISTDNIVLHLHGENLSEPMFIDLENVIVVDKQSDKVPDDWKKNHTSEVIECDSCFAFSTEDICGHQLSDHNHYSMCKLLKDEVLSPIPQFVLQKSPNIARLLSECEAPSIGQTDRFTAAAALSNELKNILKIFPSSQ